MTHRPRKPPRVSLTFRAGTREDFIALSPEEREATRSILDDLARGSVTGKALGDRHVTGDLTGLYRIRFDVPGRHRRLLRVVYRPTGPDTAEVFAIGHRDDHEVYRVAAERLQDE